jgi:hypothetical protein
MGRKRDAISYAPGFHGFLIGSFAVLAPAMAGSGMYSHVPAAILFLAVTVLAAYRTSPVDPSAANNVATLSACSVDFESAFFARGVPHRETRRKIM